MAASRTHEAVAPGRRVAVATAIGVIALGSIGIAAWVFDLRWWKTPAPGAVAMRLNAAIAFVLAGGSLLAQQHRRWRVVGIACAVPVVLLGALTLAQNVFGIDVGIDELVMANPEVRIGAVPGRIAPNAAVCFTCVGLALIMLDLRGQRLRAVAQVLVAAALLVAAVASAGYLGNLASPYPVAWNTSMSAHAAVGFLTLCVGVLFSRRPHGVVALFVDRGAAGSSARRYTLPLIVMSLLTLSWVQARGQRGELANDLGLALVITVSGAVIALLVIGNARVQHATNQGRQQTVLFIATVKDYAIFLLDARGVVTTWNLGAERIYGYGADEIIGHPVARLYAEDDRTAGRPQRELEAAARDGGYEGEHVRVRKDGSQLAVAVTMAALRNADGELTGFGKVTRDLTEHAQAVTDGSERKRAEHEREQLLVQLATMNGELEDRVARRTAQLSATLAEREALLQEVHHRVKNNLQVISSLLNLQIRRLEPGANRYGLVESMTRVEAIALIHERLYQSSDYARVPFSEYAGTLAHNIFQATGTSPDAVALEIDIDRVALSVDKAIPCGLILNELITNALKHAFPDGRTGVLKVELRRDSPHTMLLAVSDDGVGMARDRDASKPRTLGLHLVSTLVQQLHGNLELVHLGGVAVRITFPVEPAIVEAGRATTQDLPVVTEARA